MQFSQRLKELRVEKGVSQTELAEKIYVSRSAVAKWENGLGLPCEQSLELIAEYFGVSYDSLLSDSPSEAIIVDKNITISKSKKIIVAVSVACIVALAAVVFMLVYFLRSNDGDDMDGGSKARLVGIYGEIWDGVDRNNSLANEDSAYPHAYMLEKNREYRLDVNPILYGGSTPLALSPNKVTFDYDSTLFDITLSAEGSESNRTYYMLVVKEECEFAAIAMSIPDKDASGNAMSATVLISAR